ncbi:MAG: hypothetical protein AMK73_09160 [Planctomycetes bacterium SM23_32]|nr:MAG: hypothetical protein AMK73_09160 [Planctomycetes bacterium SM23_32]
MAVQERDLNGDDDFGDTNEVTYYHQNTLFSVMALTDANESVVERYRFDAYGACTVLDADGSADADGISDVGNPYTFTARRLDDESALMQYRHRWYSPTLGRFVSRDPLGYADGMALYGYVLGMPTLHTDPEGRAGADPDGATIWQKLREYEGLYSSGEYECGRGGLSEIRVPEISVDWHGNTYLTIGLRTIMYILPVERFAQWRLKRKIERGPVIFWQKDCPEGKECLIQDQRKGTGEFSIEAEVVTRWWRYDIYIEVDVDYFWERGNCVCAPAEGGN